MAARAVRLARCFAEGFGLVAKRAESLIELGHRGAKLVGLRRQARAFGDGVGARLGEFGVLRCERRGLFFATQLFGSWRLRAAARVAECAGSGRCRGVMV